MINVTLSQVSTFERVVRLGSFHAAAHDLGLTQPAVSQRIRELEQALGIRLFVRNGRRIAVTADGTAMLAYADQLLKTAGEMVLRLRTHDPLKGVLRLGLSETFALVCLSGLLERLNSTYPSLKTSLHVGDTNALSELLNEQKLDLAVISDPRVADHVRRDPIGVNQHGWFAAAASCAIDQATLTPEEFCRHHLIITPPPARLFTNVMRWFSQAGVAPRRLSMCDGFSCRRAYHQGRTGTGHAVRGGVAVRRSGHWARWWTFQITCRRVPPCVGIPAPDMEELGPGLQEVVALMPVTMAADIVTSSLEAGPAALPTSRGVSGCQT